MAKMSVLSLVAGASVLAVTAGILVACASDKGGECRRRRLRADSRPAGLELGRSPDPFAELLRLPRPGHPEGAACASTCRRRPTTRLPEDKRQARDRSGQSRPQRALQADHLDRQRLQDAAAGVAQDPHRRATSPSSSAGSSRAPSTSSTGPTSRPPSSAPTRPSGTSQAVNQIDRYVFAALAKERASAPAKRGRPRDPDQPRHPGPDRPAADACSRSTPSSPTTDPNAYEHLVDRAAHLDRIRRAPGQHLDATWPATRTRVGGLNDGQRRISFPIATG